VELVPLGETTVTPEESTVTESSPRQDNGGFTERNGDHEARQRRRDEVARREVQQRSCRDEQGEPATRVSVQQSDEPKER